MRLADWRSRFQPRPDDEGAAVSGTELGEAMASAAEERLRQAKEAQAETISALKERSTKMADSLSSPAYERETALKEQLQARLNLCPQPAT